MNTLLAVDGSDNSYEAVHALKFSPGLRSSLCVHAVDVPKPGYPMMVSEAAGRAVCRAQQNMRKLATAARSGSVPSPDACWPLRKQLRIGSPAEVIVSIG